MEVEEIKYIQISYDKKMGANPVPKIDRMCVPTLSRGVLNISPSIQQHTMCLFEFILYSSLNHATPLPNGSDTFTLS